MKSKRMAIFAAIGISLGGIVFLSVRSMHPREPSYQGRLLGLWLEDLVVDDTNKTAQAKTAVRNMGTNAIPFYLDILSYEESFFRKQSRELAESSPIRVSFLERNYMRLVGAAYAMNVLGPRAEPAFPALTNLFYGGKHSVTAAIALAGIGQKGVFVLVEALTNQRLVVRHSAAGGLGHAYGQSEIIVPALIKILRGNDKPIMRYAAAQSLGLLHENAELSVPALVESFDDPDKILRAGVIIALGQFGSKAKAATPLLLKARKDEDETVRELAEQALQNIDPESLREKAE